MSMTLHTMLTLHGWAADHNVSDTVDILARRGRGGRSTHFFFFGSGFGSAILAVPIAIIAIFGGYLMRNPDKARGLKDRVKGAWGAASAGLNSRLDPHSGVPPSAPPPRQPPAPPDMNVTAHPPNAHPASGHHFYSAPHQPVIGGQLGSPPEMPQALPAAQRAAGLTGGAYTPQPSSAPGAVMRFNAPPGWPVPPAWTPAPDWKPDPSWPPAPAGWTFWVPVVAPRPATTQRFAAGTTYSGTRPSDFTPRNGSF